MNEKSTKIRETRKKYFLNGIDIKRGRVVKGLPLLDLFLFVEKALTAKGRWELHGGSIDLQKPRSIKRVLSLLIMTEYCKCHVTYSAAFIAYERGHQSSFKIIFTFFSL